MFHVKCAKKTVCFITELSTMAATGCCSKCKLLMQEYFTALLSEKIYPTHLQRSHYNMVATTISHKVSATYKGPIQPGAQRHSPDM